MAPLCFILANRHKYDVPDLNKGPSPGSGPPLTIAPAQRKTTTYLEHDFGKQASHIAQRYAVHERSSRMYTPLYGRLDALRSLGTKGHRKGSHQGIPLSLANTRTASAQARHRQLPAEDNKLLAEQARGERGDARRDVSRMLVFRS
jgi:hypothetical protein